MSQETESKLTHHHRLLAQQRKKADKFILDTNSKLGNLNEVEMAGLVGSNKCIQNVHRLPTAPKKLAVKNEAKRPNVISKTVCVTSKSTLSKKA